LFLDTLENRLAQLARSGDRSAFGQLVDLYKDKIFHLAYRMTGSRQEAEDIVQETFMRVYANLDKYDSRWKFSTWIFRIGNNLCIDRLRKRRPTWSLDAENPDADGVDGYAMLPTNDASPEDRMVLSEMQKNIRDAIAQLPDKYRSVVVLRYLQDLSLNEIADILELPVSTVKTRLHRGRESLRRKLEHDSIL
jgi:RNA polymerase sigma-70 factor (ECF subfamily)